MTDHTLSAQDAVTDFLSHRRSVPAKTMTGPGPDADTVRTILRLGARVPDHRMMEPFRFVVLEGEGKDCFADVLANADGVSGGDRAKAATLYADTPLVICVVSRVDRTHKTPVWEQELTAGAACQNVLLAAGAAGFGAQWLTGWPAYNTSVARALDVGPNERVAGMIFIGTPTVLPEDRKRPDLGEVVTYFAG